MAKLPLLLLLGLRLLCSVDAVDSFGNQTSGNVDEYAQEIDDIQSYPEIPDITRYYPVFSDDIPLVDTNGTVQLPEMDDSFAIQHVSSGNCLRPVSDSAAVGTQLAFTTDCTTAFVKFRVTSSGAVEHVRSALCLRPLDTKDWVSLSTLCVDDNAKFIFEDGVSIQNVASKKCVLPEALVNGSDVPAQESRLVLQHNCNKNAAKFIQFVDEVLSAASLENLRDVFRLPPSEAIDLAGGADRLLPVPGPLIPPPNQPPGTVSLVLDPRTDGQTIPDGYIVNVRHAGSGRVLLACTEHRGYSDGGANPNVGYTWRGHPWCYMTDGYWRPGKQLTTRRAELVWWWYLQQPSFSNWIDGPSNYWNALGVAYGWSPPASQILSNSFNPQSTRGFNGRVRPCKATYRGSEFIGQNVIGVNACSFSIIAMGSMNVVTVTKAYQILAYIRDYNRITRGGCTSDCNGNYNWPTGDPGLFAGDIWETLFYNTVDAGACCALCRQSYACSAWTFSIPFPFGSRPGAEPVPGGCSLKDVSVRKHQGRKPIPAPKPSPPGTCPKPPPVVNSISGAIPPHLVKDPVKELRGCARDVQTGRHFMLVSMGSGRYWLKAVYVPNIRACCDLCKRTSGCKSFSFQRVWYQCYLYRKFPTRDTYRYISFFISAVL